MEVSLEPISTENKGEELASTSADDPPPPAPLARAPSVLPSKSEAHLEPEHDAPVKRPRGRPKGKATSKKAPAPRKVAPTRAKRPPSSSEDSSTDDDSQQQPRGTSAAMRHLMEDDMQTQVLQFLTARKASQQQKRNALWQQLASSGLRR